jgi:hypothetical protein
VKVTKRPKLHASRIPFLAFPGPPPQDLAALMSHDREVFERHRGLQAFVRPLVSADEFSRPSGCTCNVMLVRYIAPGVRERQSLSVAGIDLSADAWIDMSPPQAP